ncbi:unnamed protein product [Zymoseptoria tritici ST99CH_1A5]|uniref:F-box domain-containing protein n=2 Tax=Zymoseptoria tritici TaxID=1047171 RepID=F9WWX5_ZYMTI|nr:uncharacterized protein MYCGRDRAFT_107574 [Zymoseptoria tritici IPO323]EGP92044.1 hypothetical protein MYCGRDRAFT_107574 [Zymoseptoria tritici IPO323]SMY20239.1 unnamed protein product [Zymoseptoria tritici ST99CH_1A5]
MPTNRTNVFDLLPLEMIHEVASHLESDTELVRFRQVNSAIRDAIDCDGCSFWRRLFSTKFEPSRYAGAPEHNGASYMGDYQARRTWLKNGAKFQDGRSMEERRCLEILLDLILDANSGRRSFIKKAKGGEYTSRNLPALVEFAKKENITFNPNLGTRSARPNPLLEIVQVMLAPFMLDLSSTSIVPVTGYLASQNIVYSIPESRPIVLGGIDVDLEWVLHQINFWRHHLTSEAESSLFYEYDELEPHKKPRFWTEQLHAKHKPDIGRLWKGSFANVDCADLPFVRAGRNDGNGSILDGFCNSADDRMIFDLEVKLDTHKEADWDGIHEDHLHSFDFPESQNDTSSGSRSVEVVDRARGSAAGELVGKGWLHTLPSQEGVPGWQRVTLVQHIKDEFGNIDHGWICVYEGLVLPGGQIILGRWSVPDDIDKESGPFIMWNQDAAWENTLPEDVQESAC